MTSLRHSDADDLRDCRFTPNDIDYERTVYRAAADKFSEFDSQNVLTCLQRFGERAKREEI